MTVEYVSCVMCRCISRLLLTMCIMTSGMAGVLLKIWHYKVHYYDPVLSGQTFTNNSKSVGNANLFSLERFPLYSIHVSGYIVLCVIEIFSTILYTAVSNFFVCGEVNRVDVIPSILRKLEPYLDWFRTQTSLRLFATSLLIVYEGDNSGRPSTPVDIRLVDFAHTYETCSTDEGETDNNTLYGLENFVQCLSVILKNHI